jgi:gephyrin
MATLLSVRTHPFFLPSSTRSEILYSASDGAGDFPVVAPVVAGDNTSLLLSKGSIARITTGAPVPDGATAVVMVEDTTVSKASPDGLEEMIVTIHKRARGGENIREIGSDLQQGESVLLKGDMITAVGGEIGILKSIGRSHVGFALLRIKVFVD